MSWWVAGGMAAVSTLSSLDQQKQANNNQRAEMLANAEAIKYSPWTKMQTSMKGPQSTGSTGDAIGAGIQGGMQGAMFGQKMGGPPAQTGPTMADLDIAEGKAYGPPRPRSMMGGR